MVSIGANADAAAIVAASSAGKTAAVALTASGKPKEKRRNNEKRKEKSRDAARCRRSRETEIFTELAKVLPLKQEDVNQLDKASVMRVAIAYLKIREMLQLFPKIQELTGDFKIDTDDDVDEKVAIVKSPTADVSPADLFDCAEGSQIMKETLDGFLIILTNDGDITYVSDNITEYLGIAKIDILGQQIWEYSHQCDHAELREALNIKRNGLADKIKDEHLLDEGLTTDHRDLFVRFKCTLTSRGRSINIKSAAYKVIHITGHLVVNTNGNRVLVGIGRPIPHPSNIEIPLGSTTFLTKHSLDMKFTYVDDKMSTLFGYKPEDLLEKSLFECHHGADSESLMSTFKTVLSMGQGETCRYRFLGKCGGYCWIVTQATILYDKLKPQNVVCVNYVISNLENSNEIYSLAQYEANTKKLADNNNNNSNCKNESNSIESNKKQQQNSNQPVEQEATITSTTTTITENNNNKNNNDNNNLNNNNNNNNNNSEDRDNVVALKATSVSSTASTPPPQPLVAAAAAEAAKIITTTTEIDDIDFVSVVKREKLPTTTTTENTIAKPIHYPQKLNKIPIDHSSPKSTSLCQNLQNNCSINLIKPIITKPPNLLSTPSPLIPATTTKLKLPKSVTASVLRFNVVNNNNNNHAITDNLPLPPIPTPQQQQQQSSTVCQTSSTATTIFLNQTQLPHLNAAPHAQSVTASVFTPISQLPNKQQQNIAKASTATAAIFGQHQQQQQQSSLLARSEDMNKGFLSFAEDATELRMLKEEPDDLAHLAPTAVDACMPLDEATPLFSEMLVGLMPYNSLLADDINSLISTTSSSAATTSAISTTATRASPTLTQSNYSNSSNNANHTSNNLSNTAANRSSISSSSSPSSTTSSGAAAAAAAAKESLIDQFINYREESNDTNCSQHLLSPSVTSKSPEASSLPSLCSPNSLSQEDEFAFMTMNVDDDIDLTMRAPYIPMNPQDDLPLLTDDLMWCGSNAFVTEDLPLHKDSDVMTYDLLKHQLQMQQQQQQSLCNNRNLLSYQMQQQQQELHQQHFNNSLCSSPASTASSLSPSPVNHHHQQQQQQQSSGVFATDSSELAALLGGSGNGSLSILGNNCGGGTTLVGGCSDDSRSAMSPIQTHHHQQQQQQHGVLDADDFRLQSLQQQQQRQNHLLGQFVGIDCKKEKFDIGAAGGGGGGGESGLCDSIEDAFEQVYNKDSTNLDCWNEYLQINVNDTTSSSAAPTPPPTLTSTSQQQQHIDDLRQQDCKQHIQLQHLQSAALQPNIIINAATRNAATLHVPLINIQNNSKNILLQQQQHQQQQQHLQRSNSKLILNDEMLSANHIVASNNNKNKKMATIKLLNAATPIGAPTAATIRIADNKQQQQQKVTAKAATQQQLQQQHGNKRHLSAAAAAATQQLEAKRLKNSNTSIELQAAPNLLQQLMAPTMQQQQVTTINANGQKTGQSLQQQLQQQQQRNKAAAVVAQRWAAATTTLTELKPTTTITVAAASIQVQQQSNSVLKNLLDAPPPSDVKSISQILAKAEPMLTDDSMDQTELTPASPPLCISPSLTQPLSVSLPSTTAVLRNYRQNPLIGGIGVLPSPTSDTVTIANITNYNDDSNPPGLTACDTDSCSDSGIDDISLNEQPSTVSPVKILKTTKSTILGVPYDNAMSADAFDETKGVLLKSNRNAADNGLLKNPTELPPPTPPPQKIENVGCGSGVNTGGGNRKTSISFMDCSNPLLTPFLMDLCNDDYTMNTEEYLEGNDIEHVLSEWTNEMV